MSHSKFSTSSSRALLWASSVREIGLSILFVCFLHCINFAQSDPAWCNLPNDYSIPDNAIVKLSTLFPTPVASGIVSQKVFELGTNAILEVDKTFIFNYCYFKCKRGAIIKVVTGTNNSATRLYSFNSNYFSCNGLWSGIIVNPNNNITIRKSNIYDAARGIDFPPGYNSLSNELTNNVFSDNTYGIYVGNRPSSQGSNVGFTRCYGNLFNQPSNTLKDGTLASAGIFVTQFSSLRFGTQGTPQNRFIGLPYGIMLLRGSLGIIENSDFLSMNNVGFINGIDDPTDGTGILVNNSSLSILQPGNHRCQFNDNFYAGVYCTNANGPVKVNYCDFAGQQQFGVLYENPRPNTYLWVEHNVFNLSITNSIGAIVVNRPAANAAIPASSITGNTINVPNGNGGIPISLTDIVFIGGTAAALNRFIVYQNVINNNSNSKAVNGIYLLGAGDNYEVIANEVYYLAPVNQLTGSQASLGIVFDNMSGIGNVIRFNVISSRLNATGSNVEDDDKSFLKCGIHVVSCNQPFISCNTIDNTYRGLHVGEFNPGAYLGGNIMNTHVFGLDCRRNTNAGAITDIGDQVRTQNVWLDNAASYVNNGLGARYFDNNTPPFAFTVSPGSTGLASYTYLPPSLNPPASVWFSQQPGLPNNSCATKGDTIRRFYDSEIRIAKGTYSGASAVTNWDLQRRLWYNMIRNSDLVSQNTDIQAFSNATFGSSAQQFAQATYQYEQSFLSDNATALSLVTRYAQMDVLIADIASILATINQEDTTDVNATTLDALNTKWAELGSVLQVIHTTAENFDAVKNSNLQGLQTLVNALPSTQLWESVWKDILSIGIKKGQSIVLSNEDIARMTNIASYCSVQVGLARQTVLPFLPFENATPFLGSESDDNCIFVTDDRSTNLSKKLVPIEIFPNPAKDVISVNLPSGMSGFWQIFDISGNQMSTGTVSNENKVLAIRVSEFTNGLYLFRYQASGHDTQYLKFQIIK